MESSNCDELEDFGASLRVAGFPDLGLGDVSRNAAVAVDLGRHRASVLLPETHAQDVQYFDLPGFQPVDAAWNSNSFGALDQHYGSNSFDVFPQTLETAPLEPPFMPFDNSTCAERTILLTTLSDPESQPGICGGLERFDGVAGDKYGFSPSSVPTLNRSLSQSIESTKPFQCISCGFKDRWAFYVGSHCERAGHTAFRCRFEPCDFRFNFKDTDYRRHLATAHSDVFSCDECEASFGSQWRLQIHSSKTGHAAFTCTQGECGKSFSRVDTFERHKKTHEEEARRHPCKYCRKHRGKNGFKRKDHLTQHLRNYHHIGEDDVPQGKYLSLKESFCPHEDCTEYRTPKTSWREMPFQKSPDRVKHMRKVHNECDFPCPESGCDRVGGKGYFRKSDLRAHPRKVHGTNGALEGDEK